MKKPKGFIFGALFVMIAALSGFQAFETLKKGAAAYIFGYPLVLMEQTRQQMTGPEGSPANRFIHVQYFPDHNFRTVVRPNNDTLYSSAWLDLSSGPQVLSVPDTKGRYYVMPFMDAWTNVFARVGKGTTGTGPGDFIIRGPQFQGPLPHGIDVITAPTTMVWLIGRIQVNGRDDLENVYALQEKFTLTPLENYTAGKAAPARVKKKAAGRPGRMTPPDKVARMAPEAFFAGLNRLMGEQPPFPEDAPMLKELKALGIAPGAFFDINSFNPVKQLLVNKGVALARKKLEQVKNQDRSSENHWAVKREGIGTYGTDYRTRAFVAFIGLGALPPAEAAYPGAYKDHGGRQLSGKHRYRIHFKKGKTPPVEAFWSLTLYDENDYLTDNPMGRYCLGDRDPLEFNPDGSLDILIQHEKPDRGTANWLPAPAGSFSLTLRLYMPGRAFLDGSWRLPPVERVES